MRLLLLAVEKLLVEDLDGDTWQIRVWRDTVKKLR